MLAEERHKFIVDLVREQGTVTKKELAKLLNVSVETIRRDLEVLTSNQLVRKVHGGVVSNKFYTGKYPEMDYGRRKQSEKLEKSEIALTAVSFVKDGTSVALNSGTTNEAVARELAFCGKRLTVLTNSLTIVDILREDPKIQVILCGGRFDREENAFFGALATQFLDNFSVDLLFLAVSGVDLFKGCTDYKDEEASLEKKMVAISSKVIVLSSSNKINSASLLHICGLDQVSFIISDSKLDKEVVKRYAEMGHDIVVANPRGRSLLEDLDD